MENIRLGKAESSDDEVIEAARQAELHTYICSLPLGYRTQVNDKTFSGGQNRGLLLHAVFSSTSLVTGCMTLQKCSIPCFR